MRQPSHSSQWRVARSSQCTHCEVSVPYHVCNRFAPRGEIFGDPEEAFRFGDRIHEDQARDEFNVLAWCHLSKPLSPSGSNLGCPFAANDPALPATRLQPSVEPALAINRYAAAESLQGETDRRAGISNPRDHVDPSQSGPGGIGRATRRAHAFRIPWVDGKDQIFTE